jgi:carbon monoxide dehydrogenase subunit G
MGQVRNTITIARPVEVVFRVVSRVEDFPTWLPEVSEAGRIDPLVEAGSRVRLLLGARGRGTELLGTVSVFAPPHQLAITGSGGPVRVGVDASLLERDGGTELTLSIDVGAAPMLGFIVREAERRIGAELPIALERLRGLVEIEPA